MDMSKYGFRADFDENNRIVKQEVIEFEGREYFVSTVDLGLDHRFGEGSPLWYETMIFPNGTYSDEYCDRYETRGEALSSHEQLIQDINDGKYEKVDGWFRRKEKSDDTTGPHLIPGTGEAEAE
jgi:hypothetical protein